MIDLNKYTETQKKDILHTSGHAAVARGEGMGSSVIGERTKRQSIQTGERYIGSYRSSQLGSRFAAQRARTSAESSVREQQSAAMRRQPTAHSFSEPQTRRYNPYA